MRVSYAPGYQAPMPANHIFPMGKFRGLHTYLIEKKIINESRVVAPKPVDSSLLRSVHSQQYCGAILNGSLTHKEERRLGLPWSPGLAKRSVLAVQGTLNAALMALEDGISGNLAGGTHHAMPNHGEGFCVFNDVAVAIRVLKHSMWIKKVLVIDCDVHQGNGTASIFADDDDVFTFSIHGAKNYPFRKPASNMDVGLPDNTGDKAYIDTLGGSLDEIFEQFHPDLVFYLGGIDPLKTDHFGRLALSTKGLEMREEIVIRKVMGRNVPIVLLLSGGYAPTLQETVEAHAIMYKIASKLV